MTKEEDPDYQAFNDGWDSQVRMWYTPLDWVDFPSQRLFTTEATKEYRYILLLYYSMLDMFLNELGPVNEVEMFVMIFSLLFGAVLNALIFGDIAFLISSLNKKDNQFQEKLDSGNAVMDQINLKEKDQDRIREFFLQTQTTREKQEEFSQFMETIPPSL